MRTIARSALTISLSVTLLVGCGGSQRPTGPPGVMPESRTVAQAHVIVHRLRTAQSPYQVLYSFSNPPDGGYPLASLINVSGTLYGTTARGGTHGYGTVFSISTTGTEHEVRSFDVRDGSHPNASLIEVNGNLYGTTYVGGTHRYGTVFNMRTSGEEKVVHSFNADPDGKNPIASLINVNGTLYGTTAEGGPYGLGTVFGISASGGEKVLHSFSYSGSDGYGPGASLIDVNGTLYGTTPDGGTPGCGNGCGTVYSISTSGAEKVLHGFGSGYDGAAPGASLINVKGTLYGTTFNGGSYGHQQYGYGTVFSISTSGAEKVLHSFGGGSDGAHPQASLIDVKGTLYGTTTVGGTYYGGTVFSISTSGAEKVLYSFGDQPDGSQPRAGLIDVKGTLYGTTSVGGTYGQGTVFALTP